MLCYKVISEVILIFMIVQNTFKICSSQYRLSRNTAPRHYDIKIETELEKNEFTFHGDVKIEIEVIISTQTMELNVQDLSISSLTLTDIYDEVVKISLASPSSGVLRLKTDIEMQVGEIYTLLIVYNSKLKNTNVGFYAASYVNIETGKLTWIAATNFKPIYARTAFPCYDEPNFKSTFQLTLIYPDNLYALSNTNVLKTSCGGIGLLTSIFNKTANISTYQLGFALIDFYKIESNTMYGVTHSTYVRYAAKEFAKKAANLGFEMFETAYVQFGSENTYPIRNSEIKQIMMPYHETNATSHWNIIFYKEEDLLHYSFSYNNDGFNDILILISRNMIHQWFALVTPEWWSFLWLSEGLSVYYAYSNAHDLHPHNGIMGKFQIDILHEAFTIDAEEFVKPLVFNYEETDDMVKSYNLISKKAPCIIRMLRLSLTEPSFGSALKNFFMNSQYSSVNQDHLLQPLSEALSDNGVINIKLRKLFRSWTKQSGYPVVSVTVNKNKMILKQERFLSGRSSNTSTLWLIPINYEVQVGKLDKKPSYKPKLWFDDAESELEITEKKYDSKKHWVLVNIEQIFYYRVNYNEENWKLIIAALKKKHTDIRVATRAQLINDAFNLAIAGLLDYKILKDLTSYIKNEKDILPKKAYNRGYRDFRKVLEKSEDSDMYEDLTEKFDDLTSTENPSSITGPNDYI